MIPNVSSWYKRKWKVYIPTDEEAKLGIEHKIAVVILLGLIVWFLFFTEF